MTSIECKHVRGFVRIYFSYHEYDFWILTMSIKNGLSLSKDENNPERGYWAMQQQLELMNMKFREVMNGMGELIIKVASLWDGLGHRGLEGRRLVRWVISPPKESIYIYIYINKYILGVWGFWSWL